MRTRILITAAIVTAFAVGATVQGLIRHSFQANPSQAYAAQSPVQTSYSAPQPAQAGSYAATGNYAQPAAAQSTAPTAPAQAAYQPQPVHRHRSLRRQALIIGGSAAAGTAIGAVAGGGKGAAVGAMSGGVAGLVYDLFTKNR